MTSPRDAIGAAQRGVAIGDEEFADLSRDTIRPLLTLSRHATRCLSENGTLTRAALARLQGEASIVEDLLDASGARRNRAWFPFRELVAGVKLFSGVGDVLLLLEQTTPGHQLLPIEEDFPAATSAAVRDVLGIVRSLTASLLQTAGRLGFPAVEVASGAGLAELAPAGGLVPDRSRRHVGHPGKTVCYLATAFLNLSEESWPLEVYKSARERDYARCIPDAISEEQLRAIENKFHNLESLYDTHLSDSDIEDQDANLRLMRGHVSIIFRLLQTATAIAHYYERHMTAPGGKPLRQLGFQLTPRGLLQLLMGYSIAFAHRFIGAAQGLCHDILRVYAEQGQIEVPVPRFRGFHVRPSTLIARIIRHYGSKVEMRLEDEVYDASRPMELFRANELVNARKRKFIAERIVKLPIAPCSGTDSLHDLKEGLKKVWYALLEDRDVVVYDRSFSDNDLDPFEHETLAEFARRWFAHCLVLGRIDVDIDVMATFVGDQRVLEDIRALAEGGYGEDKFGNNVMLPARLAYLRR